MTGISGGPDDSEAPRRRQRLVMVGLLLTLLGILLLSWEVPTAPAALLRSLPLLGAGALATWFGGILLGNVLRPLWRSRGRSTRR